MSSLIVQEKRPIRQCVAIIEEDMFWKIKQIAAHNHFKNMSEMIRHVVENYVNEEMKKI
jgi:hypothetical protein